MEKAYIWQSYVSEYKHAEVISGISDIVSLISVGIPNFRVRKVNKTTKESFQ